MTTLKLKSPVPFPASVVGAGGFSVSKAAGAWTIEPDFSALATITGSNLGNPTGKQVWIYDPITTDYNVLTLADLGNALYVATSTTSIAIGTGSQVFTTQAGKDYSVGRYVLATSDADPTNFMLGQVTGYTDTALTLNVVTIGGSGTHADWTLSLSAASGPGGNASFSGVTTHGVMVSSSSTSAKSTAVMTDGQLLVGQSAADPLPKTLSGDVTISAAGAASIASKFLKNDTTNNLTKGFTATSFSIGSITTGTLTPDPTNGNFQHYTNGGAHTLAPPASVCTMVIECINASAGAITTSGFDVVSGDTYSSTGTKKHIFYITRTNSYKQIHVQYVTGT